jgi:hypothetical protein
MHLLYLPVLSSGLKMRCQSIVGHICLLFALTSAHLAPIHYTIARRGGGLAITDTANLSVLLDHLQDIESRFSATTRQLEKNTVVRKAKRRYDTEAGSALLGEVGRVGNWFATIELGEPAQHVRMDLDMLTADWWVQSTNSDLGSFFLDFNSKTYRRMNSTHRVLRVLTIFQEIRSGLYLFQHAGTRRIFYISIQLTV